MTEDSIVSDVKFVAIAKELDKGIKPEKLIGKEVTASVSFSYKERPKTRLRVIKDVFVETKITDEDIKHFFDSFITFSYNYA